MGTPHEKLIDQLLDDARPVRRIWPVSIRLALWLALGVLIFLITVYTGLRPDLGQRFGDVTFVMEVVSLFGAGVLLAAYGLAAAVPGREPSRFQFIIAMTLAAAVWLVPLRYPVEVGVPLGEFLRMAFVCERRTVMLALPPLVALMVALRRGALLVGTVAGCLAGAGAFLLASANMRLVCSSDSSFHLLVGHALPAVVGTGIAVLVGTVWRRRWWTAVEQRRLDGRR